MVNGTFTCPKCGMTSHSPQDAKFGWCGNCEDFTGETNDDVPFASPDEAAAYMRRLLNPHG